MAKFIYKHVYNMEMLENTDNPRYSKKFIKLTSLIRSINFFKSERNDDYLECFFSAANPSCENHYVSGERYSIYSIAPLMNAIAVKHNIIKENLDSRLNNDSDSLCMAIVLRWDLNTKRVALIEIDDIHILTKDEIEYLSSRSFKTDISGYFQKEYHLRVNV